MKLLQLFAPVALLVLLSPFAAAHDEAKNAAHPAAQVTLDYLKHAMGRDWAKSAAHISDESLADLKSRYVKQRRATMEDDDIVGNGFGNLKLAEIEALEPTEFYIRFHRRAGTWSIDHKARKQFEKSIRVKVLGLTEEQLAGKVFCHLLVRSRYENSESQTQSLELISLVKNGDGDWKIALGAQKPLVTKLATED